MSDPFPAICFLAAIIMLVIITCYFEIKRTSKSYDVPIDQVCQLINEANQ